MRRIVSILFALITTASIGCGEREQGARPDVPAAAGLVCEPLHVAPTRVRAATGAAAQLRVTGGSGTALFALEGDPHGASIEPGGGLRTGAGAASFTAVARDGACGTEVRVPVEVVGPFEVGPKSIAVARGGQVTFVASGALGDVRYTLLDRPAGGAGARAAAVDARGVFKAGDVEGAYPVMARDTGSGREERLTVVVGKPEPLRPRAAVVAIPSGSRVRLDWRGGSADVEAVGVSGVGGVLTLEAGLTYFDARGVRPGASDATVRDRFTKEKAKVRVLVGETFGAPSVVRGTQSGAGDMATGDVNGDGLPDLVVGHAERSKVASEAGGILVYAGTPHGALTPTLSAVEGAHASDRLGSVLLVRDMNGDGIDDVVAGVPDEDLGENDRGAVALYLGSKSGLSAEADRVLSGEDVNHRFGTAVVAADLTGDGTPELVVSAPGAKSPFAPKCAGGRVYVYKNRGRYDGVLTATPSQILEIRAPLTDAAEAPVPCDPSPLDGGRALALVDVDGDGVLDLAVGAPYASHPTPARSQGVVAVYRGTSAGVFDDAPGWVIQLDPDVRVDGARFGAGLDVVRDGPKGPAALVVRAPGFAPKVNGRALAGAGGFWVFTAGSLGQAFAPAADGAKKVRVVTTRVARSFYAGPTAGANVGTSATIGDVDPSSGSEYVVGAAAPGSAGEVHVFQVADLLDKKGALAPVRSLQGARADVEGFRVAAFAGGGLAVWAAGRTTPVGPFAGAVDYVAPGDSPLSDRWKTHGTFALPNFGAGDHAGTHVALHPSDPNAPSVILGTPLAPSPEVPGAGEFLRAGLVEVFGASPTQPVARASGDRPNASLGSWPIVPLDFDGDGKQEIAVADLSEAWGGSVAPSFVDPDGCVSLDAKGAPAAVPARGVVHVYALEGGKLVERFRVAAPKEAARGEPPAYRRNRTGSSLAVADVNGDGKADLVVGRPGDRDGSGAEVVLGRARDPGGKVLVACNTGAAVRAGAFVLPEASADDPVAYGRAVARVGDLDRDGCDEVAFSMSFAHFPGGPRAGILLSFGYDPTGARCAGHTTPFTLRIVPTDRGMEDDTAGDLSKRIDDAADLTPSPTGMGDVLASGGGDVTGDGVPDLVFRDTDLAFAGKRGPAVEIVSGAYLAGLCPRRVCPKGRSGPLWADGDWRVLALRAVGAPQRIVIPGGTGAPRFGSAIAVEDLSGDGVADLVIGSLDDSDAGPFAGEVRVYRGGPTLTQSSLLDGDPWMLAAGDVSERSAFGASLTTSRRGQGAWLLVGAPTSGRRGAGGEVGAAYLWRLEVPK